MTKTQMTTTRVLAIITTVSQQAGDTPAELLADAGCCSEVSLAALPTRPSMRSSRPARQKHGPRPGRVLPEPVLTAATRWERMTPNATH